MMTQVMRISVKFHHYLVLCQKKVLETVGNINLRAGLSEELVL